MPCICCGSEDRELHPLKAHIGNLKVCGPCIAKHGGTERIAAEADRLLVDWFLGLPLDPTCPVCGNPLIMYADGSHPVWCQECEKKRKAYVNAQARR